MKPFELDPPELSDGVIVVRRMTEDLLPEVARSFEIEPDLGQKLGFSEDPDEETFRKWLPTRDTGVWVAMAGAEDSRYLGDLAVHHVEWEHDRAELGFYVALGERGRGIGTRAVRLITTWLFEQGFGRVQMLTLPSNGGVHGIARRAGFEREGLLRRYFVERGNPTDAVMFSAIEPEWTR